MVHCTVMLVFDNYVDESEILVFTTFKSPDLVKEV